MKFLVDAQLPRRLARQLAAMGHDALHTLDLPAGNRTSDMDILEHAGRQGRIVVSKDSDFVTAHVLRGEPGKLLLISTGNIANDELEAIIIANVAAITNALEQYSFVELTRLSLLIHS